MSAFNSDSDIKEKKEDAPDSSALPPNMEAKPPASVANQEHLSVDELKKIDRLLDKFETQTDKSPNAVKQFLQDVNESENSFLFRELIQLCDSSSSQEESRHWLKNFPKFKVEIETFFDDISRHPQDRSELNSANSDSLGDYRIVAEIARGGMGIVYKAVQTKLNRVVALKRIITGSLASEAETERFLIEAEAAAKLQHPNIVQVFDSGELDSLPFFSMEFVDGKSLAQHTNGVPQNVHWSSLTISKVADAVEHAHRSGIIHRDLKPSNILMTQDDEPKVTDFGLAKLADNLDSKTRTGDLMGTASYMAPEQARGQISLIGPWSDVYGLGAIFYELLVGRPPFRGETSWDTISQLIEQDPIPVKTIQPKTPSDVNTIITKCLQKEPEKRYPSAQELKDDIDRFLNGEPILAKPTSRIEYVQKWIRRNRSLSLTIAVSFVLLVASISIGVIGILRENDRFRTQRDHAVANLYDALINDTRAQLVARSGPFWIAAKENLEEATKLQSERRDDNELRNLAIEWMGNHHPCFVANEVQKHSSVITSVTLSPNKEFIASGSRDGQLFITEKKNGKSVGEHRFASAINDIKFSRESSSALVACDDQTIWLVRTESDSDPILHAEQIKKLNVNVRKIAIDPNNNVFLGCEDGSVRKSSVFADELSFQVLNGQVGEVTDLNFSSDFSMLVAVGKDNRLCIWDCKRLSLLRELELARTPTCAIFTNDDKQIAWSDTERFAILYEDVDKDSDLPKNTARHVHTQRIIQLARYQNNNLITSSADGTLSLFDARSREFIARAARNLGPVTSFVFDSDSQKIIAGYQKGHVLIWSIHRSEFITKYQRHHWSFFDQKNVLVSTSGNYVTLTDVNEKFESQSIIPGESEHAGTWETIPLFEQGLIARAKHGGFVDFIDVESSESVLTIDVCPGSENRDIVWSLDATEDGRFVFAGSGTDQEGFLNVIDLETKRLVSRESVNKRLVYGVCSRRIENENKHLETGSREIFSCSTDGSVHAWLFNGKSLEKDATQCLIQLKQGNFLSIDLSDDGLHLAAATYDDRIFVWTREPGQPFDPKSVSIVEDLHGNAIRFVEFVLNDEFIASGSENGSIVFLPFQADDPSSLHDGNTIRFKTGSGQVRKISFSNDHQFMAVNSYAAPTFVWDFREVQRQLKSWNVHWDQTKNE